MKKYILLVIGLLMIANNAFCDVTEDVIEKPIITVKEAYLVMKSEATDDKTTLAKLNIASFSTGIMIGLIEGKEGKLDCDGRPLRVFINVIFRRYEDGKLNDNKPFYEALVETINEQCYK